MAERVAAEFGLGQPIAAMVRGPESSLATWRLDTTSGAFLVKRLWQADAPSWWPNLAAAMAFERRASEAGIAMPRPFPPRTPGHELAADLPPHGMFRVYEWLNHRLLSTDDDIAEWLGRTLSAIHQLEPAPAATGPDWYGIHPRETWLEWIDNAGDQSWVELARKRLPFIEKLTTRIARAFDNAGDPVRTHSDIEPWNVLYTARGPVLIDWDTGGIDSATLQAAQAAYAFAGGDIARTGEILAAYRTTGGHIVDAGPDLLVRRVGLQLSRLGYDIAAGKTEKITRKLAELPQFVAELTARSREIAQGL